MYDPALFRDIARPVPLGRLRSPALDPMWRLAHITQKRREKNVFAMRTLSCGVLPKQKTALSTHPFRATCVYKQAQTYQPMKYETAYAGRYRKHHKHTAAILASGEGPVIAKNTQKRRRKDTFPSPRSPILKKFPGNGRPRRFFRLYLEQHLQVLARQGLPGLGAGNDGFGHALFGVLQAQNLLLHGVLAD